MLPTKSEITYSEFESRHPIKDREIFIIRWDWFHGNMLLSFFREGYELLALIC